MALDPSHTSDAPTDVVEDPRLRLLGALAVACRELGLEANVVARSPTTPPTLVVERLAMVEEITCDQVAVSPDVGAETAWCWLWAWGDPIVACDDATAAALLVRTKLGVRGRM